VIADPPLLGAVHVMSTLLPFLVVVGADGVLGIAAARTLTDDDSELNPTMLRA